jgi:hypothetical protein
MEMTNPHSLHDDLCRTEHPDLVPEVLGGPDDVLDDPRLTRDEKRAVLASWASDANAVPHLPSLRQLPDGSIVRVHDILRALKALDGGAETVPARCNLTLLWQRPRPRKLAPRRWSRYPNRPDDDDDPPPAPAFAAVRPREGGGGAFACPELVAA